MIQLIHTKIVCTIGPASDSVEILEKLMEAGMNVARLNFSHGSHEEHGKRIMNIRQAAQNTGSNVAILLDTKGPEIRLGSFKESHVPVEEGQEIILTTRPITGADNIFPVTYQGLPQDVMPGNTILIDDGLIGLEVKATTEEDVVCYVKNPGDLLPNKGINVPGVDVNLPGLMEKDVEDILFGIEQEIDFIAASFVRKGQDILDIRRLLEEKASDIDIIAKIESRSGVKNLDEILKVSDGIMVARGDLGVEIPPEEVPLIQKLIIDKCNEEGKPVITATQMLDSMMRNPRPTRAEASDVANAILDGTDAVMLSGETASGKYPVEAVRTMTRIASKTETALKYAHQTWGEQKTVTITDAISQASFSIAHGLKAAAIITPTSSGSTARMVSKYRPKTPIIATTPAPRVKKKLALVWGVQGVLTPMTTGTDEMVRVAVSTALKEKLINNGDLVVVTAGVPAGTPGTTNLIKVHVVNQVTASGTGIGQMVATGIARVVQNEEEARARLKEGDILVTSHTDRDYMDVLGKAGAVITEEGGLTSHAAIVAINLGIAAVVGVENATTRIPDGTIVTVDSARGQIYLGVTQVL